MCMLWLVACRFAVKQPALDFHEQQLEQQDERVSDSGAAQGQDNRVRVMVLHCICRPVLHTLCRVAASSNHR
jgi:hypothetical protein